MLSILEKAGVGPSHALQRYAERQGLSTRRALRQLRTDAHDTDDNTLRAALIIDELGGDPR